MDGCAGPLYATRARSIERRARIEIVAAPSSAPDAVCGFLSLPVRERSDSERASGTVLRLAAAHGRSRAFADGSRETIAGVGQPASKRCLMRRRQTNLKK